ncbi:MAG: ATPase, partial [Selenomonadaceae bacterium]|nr:ATPase [Selenomonadaceae bacterium]
RIYYQVEPSLQDAGVRKKALRPLKSIPDQYEKVILSMDRSDVRDFDGIRNLNIVDFLMEE